LRIITKQKSKIVPKRINYQDVKYYSAILITIVRYILAANGFSPYVSNELIISEIQRF
jgi:hypothetical protein